MGENLPDLKSRVILDTAAAEAKAMGLINKIKSLGSGHNLGNIFGDVEKGATRAASTISKISTHLGNMSNVAVKAGSSLEHGIFGPFEQLGGSIPIIGGVILGLTGLFAALDHVANSTSQYGAQVLRNSELVGMSTTQYQGLAQAVSKFGMDQTALTQVMLRFDRNLESGGPALKQMGLNLHDVGVTSNDTGTALNQLSAYLSNNTNEMQRNAVAVALLGRGGTSMIQVLSKGPQFLQNYTNYLSRMGVILDEDQVKTAAMAATVDNQFHDALHGLETQVGVQLEGAFSRLYLSILQALGPTPKEAFANIGKAISNVLSWVIGLIDELFNLKITLASMTGVIDPSAAALTGLSDSAGDTSDQFDGMTGSVKSNEAAMNALQESTRLQTQALDDQIQALDEQYSALDNQIKMSELLQQQQDDAGTSYLAQLQAQNDMITTVTDERRHGGESLLDYERRMEQKNVQDKIKGEQNKRAQVKTSQQIQLEELKKVTDAQKKSLTDQKQALSNYLAAATSADAAATAQANALSNSFTSNSRRNISTTQGAMDGFFKDVNSNSSIMGAQFADKIKGMIGNIGDLINNLSKVAGAIAHVVDLASAAGNATQFLHSQISGDAGRVTKDAINLIFNAKSIDSINQIGNQAAATNILDGDQMKAIALAASMQSERLHGQSIPKWQTDQLNALRSKVGAYAQGGRPPAGVPYLVGEYGPEIRKDDVPGTIYSNGTQPPGGHGGNHFTAIFNGPVADQFVANRIQQRWAAAARRKGLRLTGGITP